MIDKPSANGHSNEAELQAAQVTAYALGQLAEAEAVEIEKLLEAPAHEYLRRQASEVRQLATALDATPVFPDLAANHKLRAAVELRLDEMTPQVPVRTAFRTRLMLAAAASSCAALLIAVFGLPAVQMARELAKRSDHSAKSRVETVASGQSAPSDLQDFPSEGSTNHLTQDVDAAAIQVELEEIQSKAPPKNDQMAAVEAVTGSGLAGRSPGRRGAATDAYGGRARSNQPDTTISPSRTRPPEPWESKFANSSSVQKSIAGSTKRTKPASDVASLATQVTPRIIIQDEEREILSADPKGLGMPGRSGGEQYELPPENPFRNVREAPLSTFSIDVDTASYANVRRFLTSGRLPPPAAVRIEELLNYFSYQYPQPKGDEPFSVNFDSADCPWQPGHVLLRVGLKGKEVHRAERPSSNLVFLIDVSGSMADENKLPLLKTSLAMMVTHLTPSDRVSIVVYAGEAGTKLDSARGNEQDKILGVIQALGAGGSTHGSAGIQVAYDLAKKNFIAGGVNRVIWATDGDLNVGVTDDQSLVTLIKEKAASGVFLTVLGVGEGNLKDAKLEKLADNGNGIYAYLDTIKEARKVLIEQMSGSLVTIAKDVKMQIEFNPAEVAAYRLIGYENRVLAARDFHDDKKDAGEIGAGHTVTALYELVPASLKTDPTSPEGELKYQKQSKAAVEDKPAAPLSEGAASGELLTLKLRYKQPDAERSVLREFPFKERGGRFSAASGDFQFAAAVAQFGMLLRGSQHRGGSSWSAVLETAAASLGEDSQGLRAEFVDLVRKAQELSAR